MRFSKSSIRFCERSMRVAVRELWELLREKYESYCERSMRVVQRSMWEREDGLKFVSCSNNMWEREDGLEFV